ncbi:hypothetical protein V8C35DRAFT_261991 [Trichoderma chlorosporum]
MICIQLSALIVEILRFVPGADCLQPHYVFMKSLMDGGDLALQRYPHTPIIRQHRVSCQVDKDTPRLSSAPRLGGVVRQSLPGG